MKKLFLSSVVAASVVATASLAAPSVSTSGTGQFLIAPGYFASGKFETKLELVNTDLTRGYIYRAVVRESASSNETDFYIALSPSDVWDARLYSKDGKVYLYSKDDSNYRIKQGDNYYTPLEDGNGVSLSENFAQGELGKKGVQRTFSKGYVEFYPVAYYDFGTTDKVDKEKMYKAIDGIANNTAAMTIDGKYEAMALENLRDAGVAGYATVINGQTDAAMTIPMLAYNEVGIDTIQTGGLVEAGADTNPNKYLSQAGFDYVYKTMNYDSVTLIHDETGDSRAAFYMTFWNDTTGNRDTSKIDNCRQLRTFEVGIRDMEENRPLATKSIISPRPHISNGTYQAKCEFATMAVKDLVKASNAGSDYNKGMIHLSNFETVEGKNKPEAYFIPTTIRAVKGPGGTFGYSWVYVPGKLK